MEPILQSISEDLRLALLLIGGVLLLAIVLWEVVQRRRAARAEREYLKGPLGQSREASESGVRVDPLFRDDGRREPTVEVTAEPELELPEIQVRDRLVEPPVVDLDAAISASAATSAANEHDGLPVMSSAAATPAEAAAATAAPRLEIPTEEQRVIVALRVVARSGERFTGASLRQALQGEGFVYGEMNIFHRSVGPDRVLMSAASLTKPGSFDLDTMDSSLFLGLNLFAVLPGPLPGRDCVDKLLLAGHTLAQRLRGELQDSRGQALTETRLAEMRREAASVDGVR